MRKIAGSILYGCEKLTTPRHACKDLNIRDQLLRDSSFTNQTEDLLLLRKAHSIEEKEQRLVGSESE